MNQDKTFLGTEPIGKLLRQLAVPTVIAQLVNMLYNIVDRIYIGHIPGNGDLALTGVGVCLPLILIVSAFAALVASGGAPRASIYMGKQDHATAEKILGGCFALQLIVSAVLTAVLLLWNRPLLLTFGASENTIDYAAAYMSVYAIGTVFVQLTLGMNAFITAQGFAQIGMRTVLIGAVANIVLDPLFIFALNMGVRGAALATIISQCLSCVWVLRFLTGPKTMLRLKKENIRIAPALVLPCVALGSATFIMQASESVISMCFNSSLLKYGGDIAVGAMTILSSVMQFAMLPLQGIGQGAQPIISYNYGARNTERVPPDLLAAAESQPVLLRTAVGDYSAVPRGICQDVYPQGGVDRLYRDRASYLLRRAVPVRHPNRLPDGLCVHRRRRLLHYCGGAAEIRAAAAADLPAAPAAGESDYGSLRGGAGGGRHRGDLYSDPVLSPGSARRCGSWRSLHRNRK